MSLGIIGGNSAAINIIDIVVDCASVAAGATSEQEFTVVGLKLEDMVYVNRPDSGSGLVISNARVSAADTLALTFINTTGSPIDPSSQTYRLLALRPEGAGGATNLAF